MLCNFDFAEMFRDLTYFFFFRYTLQASTFQLAVLLQFNNSDSLTIAQLQVNVICCILHTFLAKIKFSSVA